MYENARVIPGTSLGRHQVCYTGTMFADLVVWKEQSICVPKVYMETQELTARLASEE